MEPSHRITLTHRLNPQSLEDNLLEAFARMNIQFVLFGFPSCYLHVVAEDLRSRQHFHIPDKFDSLEEAQQYLEVLLNAVLHLVEASRSGNYTLLDATSPLSDRQALQASLSASGGLIRMRFLLPLCYISSIHGQQLVFHYFEHTTS